MFEIPGSDIVRVHVTDAVVRKQEAPIYYRGERATHSHYGENAEHTEEHEEDRAIELQIKWCNSTVPATD